MATGISGEGLKGLLGGNSRFALIDLRESGEYNSTHIPDSSLIPRWQLEFQIPDAIPVKDVPVVSCDDDGRQASLAAATLMELGDPIVSALQGGIAAWSGPGLAVEQLYRY